MRPSSGWRDIRRDRNISNSIPDQEIPVGAPATTHAATEDDGVRLRKMTAADLPAAHVLSDALRWPHRPADWEQAFRHAEGVIAERDGEIVGTGLRFRWGPRDATIGLVIVAPPQQGRRIGHRLMSALLDGLDRRRVLLNATLEGRGLYERLGFVRVGELRQHQGIAQPAPLVALDSGWRLRPADASDATALKALDAQARGMPRDALLDELLAEAEATVVLDHEGDVRGFGLLRRFGRGHAIGPVVAPDDVGARAIIAHLAGMNAGRFTRIDIDLDSGLAEWLEAMGLLRVDAPVTMQRAPSRAPSTTVRSAADAPRLFAIVTQAFG
jgi:ribosomal protein S18 acetylase RimI-like enzyme